MTSLLSSFVEWLGRRRPRVRIELLSLGVPAYQIDAEIVDEPFGMAIGLMWRQRLAPDTGMLFLPPRAKRMRFWMKNTLLSLDLVMIRDGVIVAIFENAKPGCADIMDSVDPVSSTVELPAGTIANHGIAVGWAVRDPSEKRKL